MPGPLDHSPADVLAAALVLLGQCPDSLTAPWSAFVNLEPDQPERCVVCSDDTGVLGGRIMQGEVQEHHGVQVSVRAEDHKVCYNKARAIATALDGQYETFVTLDSTTYLVRNCNRTGDVIPIPKDPASTSRNYCTINYLLSLRKRG